ncbi:MAG: hypothetical protein ACJA01_000841 [Saprospiraceae bacterium]|jgi:hypothetical protein
MLDLIGRLHILILHLPIGILLLGVIFEWLHFLNFSKISVNVRSMIFGIGSLSALGTCVTGYLLSTSGDYNYNLIANHQWAGIITTVFAFLTWWTVAKGKHTISPWIGLIIAGSLSIAGHLGGTITHGDDFLTLQTKEKISDIPVFAISDVPSAKVYKDVVHPILQAKCVHCHGPSKKKGKLRLDTYEDLIKGGKSDLALLSTVHEQSELISRLDLPISSDEHMPPKDKRQLTKDEKSIIERWLSEGFDEQINVAALEKDRDNIALVQRIVETSATTDSHHEGATIAAEIPEVEIEGASEDQIEVLRDMGVVVLNAGEESPFLELNFVNIKMLDGDHWQALKAIAPNILRLKLSDLNVTDLEMNYLTEMTHLTKLYLDNTDISDKGLTSLKDLKFLNYLNVNSTSVSNIGIENMNEIVSLQTIYAYQSEVVLEELKTSKIVETGNYKLESYPQDTMRIPQS